MKTIEATIGYREIMDNGEVRYYAGNGDEGLCYKDNEAFNKGEGVCYIREAMFCDDFGDAGREYVTDADLTDCDNYTRAQIEQSVREYFEDDEFANKQAERYPDFIKNTAQVIFNEAEWQGVDIMLNELNWDEDLKHFGCLNETESETEQLRPIDPKRMIEDIWDILLHNTKYITPEIFLAKYHKYFDCIDCSKGIIYLTDGADTYKLSLEKTTPIDEIVI